MNAPHNPQPIIAAAHESALGRWTSWRRLPAPLLAPYVTELQGYVEDGGRPLARDEFPTGLVHMIIVLDYGFWLADPRARGGRRPLDSTFVAGMHRMPATVGSCGVALCMQVDFTPLGARRFLGIDNVELADQVVDLADMLPELDRTMRGQLSEARSWEARFAWLEGCLARRILTRPDDDPRVVFAWQALYASGGNLAVGTVAEHLGISRKHLISLFRRQVGVPPKTYGRIVRFSKAVALLQSGAASGEVSLADVATACGYSDQAHFNREIRRLAAATPSALLRRLVPDGGIIAEGA